MFDPKEFLTTVTTQAGVYQMLDASDNVLYVGKAKNLKYRLSSYFRSSHNTIKTQAMVAKIANIQLTITPNESAALILEQSLIKSLKPPYNISLRDDKSYPHIFISDKQYPRISFHRGRKAKKGQYFGPYPNAQSVFQTLNFVQKAFRIRQCEDSVYNHRTRPCLQYQIDRCTAPCVDFISEVDYQHDVHQAALFLQGKSQDLLQELAKEMEVASGQLNFELAASIRDKITMLRSIQSASDNEHGRGSVDIFAFVQQSEQACVHVLFIRDGRILGSKSYFNQNKLALTPAEYLLHFIEQFYLSGSHREIPHEILVNHAADLQEQQALLSVLSEKADRKLSLLQRVQSQKQKWLSLAVTTAEQVLTQRIQSKSTVQKRLAELTQVLELDDTPERMECFDISHSSGELTVASCVVFTREGAAKSDYRKFNIEGITAGDDYAAMEQALTRRYSRLQKEEATLPDLLIVDGGKGQMTQAKKVMAELGIQQILLLGIAKGTTRKAGFETLVFEDGREKTLDSTSSALHLLQEIRDEAHRFAITGHKQRRDKKRKHSVLEDIEGVGAKRRRDLLHHFGGLQAIEQASVDDLAKVSGISKKLAQHIYDSFH